MFSFFRKKTAGKPESAAEASEASRRDATARAGAAPVVPRPPKHDYDVTNEKSILTPKDVVNLLIPQTNYNQKKEGGSIFNIMGGKKRRKKYNNLSRAESCREISPQKEMNNVNLQRSPSELNKAYKQCEVTRSADDVTAPTTAKNTTDVANSSADPADFVKALVLQKYANKSPIESKKQHVSLVYVSDEPNIEEKRHAEALLRQIAKSIDCTIDKLNAEKEVMGATDSKNFDKPRLSRNVNEPVYETIEDTTPQDGSIKAFKNDLKGELEKLLQQQNESDNKEENNSQKDDSTKMMLEDVETSNNKKKSNLKPPRSDTEGCSDDDRSDCGKKRVTFRKHIVFDDGDQQTDEEVNSSFESLTSSGEESAEEDLEVPDNDELLGGVVVSRNENENKTVIENINDTDTGQCIQNVDPQIKISVECSDDELRRISSDNSDSGFLEISDKNNGSTEDLSSEVKTLVASESESEVSESEVTESVTEEEEIEEIEEEEEEEFSAAEDLNLVHNPKSLVSQESKFQSQVAAITELAETRCGEAEKARDLISQYRKEIEAKDLEIERLKCELSSAYKESQLVRQRSRSLEEELCAARNCSADLADQLNKKNDEALRQLRSELEAALTRGAELESKLQALETERDRLEHEKRLQEQRAAEALETAESNTTKWRLAHEAARSQAAARAERMLADCEWKMRELEKRARNAEKQKTELTEELEKVRTEKSQPTTAHVAELTQLRGLATEQQRSVQALTLQLQRVETREEALKLEVHRLKELLEKHSIISKDKEERYLATIERLEQQHTKALETAKSEQAAAFASSRAALERTHAERTRTALAQLRAEAEKDAKNADRRLREVTTKFENLKETLSTKEREFEIAIAEANSKADWELLQLRHLLDKADINYANNMEQAEQKFEMEKELLIEEWSAKLKAVEDEASLAKDEAKTLLETTRNNLIAEKNEMISKLKEEHRRAMDEQWEQFMSDKEHCLTRMKAECIQEGEEDRVKREKELLEELAELKSQIQSKNTDYDNLAVKAAACGRTLAVTEQELREALAREKELREKRSDDYTKIKQAERSSRDQVEHLTRKCACLRKLFDDMRTRLSAKERVAEQEAKVREKELAHLRAEVARLTKLLMEQGSPKLGARTRADGCETSTQSDESFLCSSGPRVFESQTSAPRRKGGTLRTPEPIRKRPTLPDLPSLPPQSTLKPEADRNGRPRAKSVDLPAVQVPGRIKQLQERTAAN